MISSARCSTCDSAMDKTSPSLSFDTLRSGQVGISPVWGSFLAEAASHCLQSNDHVHPVCLFITGDVCTPGKLAWRGLTAEENRSWADPDEAAEYGAYGVAILVALPLTGTLRVERSAKWGGFDYWLSKDDGERSIFQRAARMEVSGIFKGTKPRLQLDSIESWPRQSSLTIRACPLMQSSWNLVAQRLGL